MTLRYVIYGLTSIVAISSLAYYYTFHRTVSYQHTIAVIQPISHQALDEIVQGFEETIKKEAGLKYRFAHYNANGDSSILKAQIEDIINKQYCLVCTVATDPTVMAIIAARKKELYIPIVFAAAEPPADLTSDERVTGTNSQQDLSAQLDALIAVKPTTRAIMLVYNPAIKAGENERDKEAVATLAQKRGLLFSAVAIAHTSEIAQRASAGILHNTPDVIMVLMDNTVVSGIDALISLCNKHGITLYTSDHNSGKKGAALSFGHVQKEFGIHAAHKALEILEHGTKPRDIPISAVSTQTIQFNSAVASPQGLSLTPDLRARIRAMQGTII
jgi:putative ABC transport system substrate-binding protein